MVVPNPDTRHSRLLRHSLLDPPAEIRRSILACLLISVKPIHWGYKPGYDVDNTDQSRSKSRSRHLPPVIAPSHQIWPEILSTCHILHQEGQDLLYENSLGVHMGLEEGFDYHNLLINGLNDTPSLTSIYSQLNRFSHIDVTLHSRLEDSYPVARDDNRGQLYQELLNLSKMLARRTEWADLTIRLSGEDYDSSWANESCRDRFGPQSLAGYALLGIRWLRGRRSVSILGITASTTAAYLKNLVIPGPTIVLDGMLEQVRVNCDAARQIHNWIVDLWPADQHPLQRRFEDGIRAACDADDVPRFLKQREIYCHLVSLIDMLVYADMFRDDGHFMGDKYFHYPAAPSLVNAGQVPRVRETRQTVESVIYDLARISNMSMSAGSEVQLGPKLEAEVAEEALVVTDEKKMDIESGGNG